MRMRLIGRIPLAWWLIAPAAVAIFFFFLAPVLLTALFSFTSLGSETPLFGHRYVVAEDTLKRLRDTDFPPDVIEVLAADRYVLDAATFAALEGLDRRALTELRDQYDGAVFSSKKELDSLLKRELKNRLRRFKDRKTVIDAARRSVRGVAFDDATVFRDTLAGLGIRLSDTDFDLLARTVDSAWRWTTDNYREIANSPFTGKILLNTLFYVATTLVLFNTGFALVLAMTTYFLPKGQGAFFRAVWLIPRISPSVIYVLLWKWFSADRGFISALVAPLGVTPNNWLLEFPWVFVILINGFVGASMGMIIFSSALQAVPRTLLWAAAVDGANRVQQVFRILLPQLRWPILFVTSYQTLSLLTSFEYIQLATNGGPGFYTTEVWALNAFHVALNNYFGNLRYGYGATLAVVLVVIGIVLSLIYLRFFKFKELVRRPLIEE